MKSRIAQLAVIGMVALLMQACGSKSYSTDKTIVYKNSIYNVSQVRQLSSNGVATMPGGGTKDIMSIERREFNDLVEQNGPLAVSLVFNLDDQQIVYREGTVEKYNTFRDIKRSWERAREDIQDFLADRKDTQLELK
ncbi:MAG: hypothetical protein AAGE01_11610 [Pseudomonadota bacterium]